jgi:uncharacterized UBP type Zn finger protein
LTESNKPVFNEVVLDQLKQMGFPEIRAQKALSANPGADAESAMMWLLEHGDDAGAFYAKEIAKINLPALTCFLAPNQ